MEMNEKWFLFCPFNETEAIHESKAIIKSTQMLAFCTPLKFFSQMYSYQLQTFLEWVPTIGIKDWMIIFDYHHLIA